MLIQMKKDSEKRDVKRVARLMKKHDFGAGHASM
jgi:hypothetical protein